MVLFENKLKINFGLNWSCSYYIYIEHKTHSHVLEQDKGNQWSAEPRAAFTQKANI